MLAIFLVMAPLLASALTILAITIGAAILFYIMYHTFHGDLPFIMKTVIVILLIIGLHY